MSLRAPLFVALLTSACTSEDTTLSQKMTYVTFDRSSFRLLVKDYMQLSSPCLWSVPPKLEHASKRLTDQFSRMRATVGRSPLNADYVAAETEYARENQHVMIADCAPPPENWTASKVADAERRLLEQAQVLGQIEAMIEPLARRAAA